MNCRFCLVSFLGFSTAASFQSLPHHCFRLLRKWQRKAASRLTMSRMSEARGRKQIQFEIELEIDLSRLQQCDIRKSHHWSKLKKTVWCPEPGNPGQASGDRLHFVGAIRNPGSSETVASRSTGYHWMPERAAECLVLRSKQQVANPRCLWTGWTVAFCSGRRGRHSIFADCRSNIGSESTGQNETHVKKKKKNIRKFWANELADKHSDTVFSHVSARGHHSRWAGSLRLFSKVAKTVLSRTRRRFWTPWLEALLQTRQGKNQLKVRDEIQFSGECLRDDDR